MGSSETTGERGNLQGAPRKDALAGPPPEDGGRDETAPDWKSYVNRNPNPPMVRDTMTQIATLFGTYADIRQHPTISLFQQDDRVWVVSSQNRAPRGPCTIVAVLGGERYKVREISGGMETEEAGEDLRYRL